MRIEDFSQKDQSLTCNHSNESSTTLNYGNNILPNDHSNEFPMVQFVFQFFPSELV